VRALSVKITEIIELACRNGAVPAEEILGLSHDEVAKVRETNARGQALPVAYEEFLIRAGRSFGSIGERFNLCYPEVLEIGTDAASCAQRTLALLDESDVLIGHNIGVDWYCLRAGEPDPPVRCWSELQATFAPTAVEPSFSRWLHIVVSVSGQSG
jgi:hypothetical protein